MFKILNCLTKQYSRIRIDIINYAKLNKRTFLSEAYYCREVWEHRLNNPLLQKVKLDELYYDLDQRYQKTRQMSAVDVDIFANATTDASRTDELLDLVYKLRLSADTGNTLNSTSHAVIRALIKFENDADLLNVLDDRLNYGLFLDFYTANLLFDIYWKSKNFTSGTRIACQLMLQEEFSHPLSNSFSLLHCWNYLLNPVGWSEHPSPVEPEEEVKVRVKYLRNLYDDDHFDLRDSKKIIGKTLTMFTNNKSDSLNKSLNILGLALYEKSDLFNETVSKCIDQNIVLYEEIIHLIPEKYKKKTLNLSMESTDVQNILKNKVIKAIQETSEGDIAEQCKIYSKWETDRMHALEEQKKRLHTAKRLSNIDDLKTAIKEKETKLWFFDNEEKIELAIEAKKVYYPKRWFGKKKKPKKIDESYVPPEVQATKSGYKT